MAKLSSREQRAKELGVKVDYSRSAKQQGIQPIAPVRFAPAIAKKSTTSQLQQAQKSQPIYGPAIPKGFKMNQNVAKPTNDSGNQVNIRDLIKKLPKEYTLSGQKNPTPVSENKYGLSTAGLKPIQPPQPPTLPEKKKKYGPFVDEVKKTPIHQLSRDVYNPVDDILGKQS